MEQTGSKWLEEVIRRQAEDIKEINACIQKLPEILEKKYVLRNEYEPVRLAVFGLIALILTAVGGVLLKQVLK